MKRRIYLPLTFMVASLFLCGLTFAAQENAKPESKEPAKHQASQEHKATPETKTEKPLEERLVGQYLGFEGNDHIGIEIGNRTDKDTFLITVYEEGLPNKGHKEKEDDRYEGTAILHGHDTLEIELTKKFDGMKSEHLARKERKLKATIDTKNGELVLRIPKGEHGKPIDVIQLNKPISQKANDYPEKEMRLEKELYGYFRGTEGKNQISMEIFNPKHGLFPIMFYEKDHPEHAAHQKKDEKQVHYIGCAVYNQGKLQIVLTEKYEAITKEHLERPLHKLTAEINEGPEKITLTIPKTHVWEKVEVTKTLARKNTVPQHSVSR